MSDMTKHQRYVSLMSRSMDAAYTVVKQLADDEDELALTMTEDEEDPEKNGRYAALDAARKAAYRVWEDYRVRWNDATMCNGDDQP